jgi:glycosyltransferase involved in cell wall biosynthesis
VISIVVPAFNESENIYKLITDLKQSLDKVSEITYEIVIVDDGSTDATFDNLVSLHNQDPQINYIKLSQNFGSHAAIMAGLSRCTGDAAIIMAADLQDPPQVIESLVKQWKAGYQVVWACRETREGEPWYVTLPSKFYYLSMNAISSVKQFPKGADFFLISRDALDKLTQISISNTSIFMLVAWLNFKQTSLTYVKKPRHAGKSKWTLSKKIKLFLDSITSFSGKDIEKRFKSSSENPGFHIAKSSLD